MRYPKIGEGIDPNLSFFFSTSLFPTVDGGNPAPVEVGSLSHLQGFKYPPWLAGFQRSTVVKSGDGHHPLILTFDPSTSVLGHTRRSQNSRCWEIRSSYGPCSWCPGKAVGVVICLWRKSHFKRNVHLQKLLGNPTTNLCQKTRNRDRWADKWAMKQSGPSLLKVYRGWNLTQLHGDYFINHYKDPY